MYFPLTEPTLCYYSLVVVLLLCVPHMVLILYICYKLVNTLGITECLKTKGRLLKRCVMALRPPTRALMAETNTGSLPDRLINPGEYGPLLPTTEQHTAADTTANNDLVNKGPKNMNLWLHLVKLIKRIFFTKRYWTLMIDVFRQPMNIDGSVFVMFV